MEDKSTNILESLLERTEQYAKTTVELYQLKALSKTADLTSSLASQIALAVSMICVFLILNIGLALWIGEELGKSYYGFFILGGFYTILSGLVYLFRDQWIKTPVSNSIIIQALK